jgi:hypothetical protein
MIVITGSIFQLFGPMPERNSRYYSCESNGFLEEKNVVSKGCGGGLGIVKGTTALNFSEQAPSHPVQPYFPALISNNFL